MSTAITTLAGAESAIVREQSILGIIQRAASDPSVDVAKMRELLDLQKDVMATQAEAAFTSAMIDLKPHLPRIAKHGRIQLGSNRGSIQYAKYEDIADAVGPLLAEHGFSISYTSEMVAGQPPMLVVELTVSHRQGHSRTYKSVPLPMTDDTGAKSRVQGAGSVFSYGKRYVLCSAFDIVTENEDDDGSGEGVEPITQDQADNIRRLLAENGRDETRLLQLTQVSSIEDIQQRHYIKVVGKIKTRAK